ncbi:MAG: hypothetical protein K1060chlam1_00223 [Candidatus Anoxychlamydiales bacterium]|nr:hypothetical protein [Candidatus Anoxychlamydiales bacterium]
MKHRDRKLDILRELGQESEPVALSHLAKVLELNYSDRTIRRLLNELITEGLVKKFGHTRGAKYIAVKILDRILDHEPVIPSQDVNGPRYISSCFGSESLEAIEKINKPLFERQPITYNTDWLKSYQPNKTFYLPRNLRNQLQNAGHRANGHDPAGTYAHRIFNRLIIDLSYNSSRLEGNTYSLLETERLLLHGDGTEGKLDEEKVMILNHKEAIRYLVDNAASLKINQNVICTIHYLLADGLVEPKYAGKVRDFGVRISGSTYIPFEDPKQLQLQIDKISQKAAMISDPFEQSFFLLVHISYLQAFADVNKRTARLAANISFIKENLVPLAFSDVVIQDYMSAIIAIYELQDVRPLIDLYVYSYLRTCAAYDSTVKSLGFDEVRVRFRHQRRKIIREIIINGFVGNQLEEYIQSEAKKNNIPQQIREKFIEDIFEDLEQINESRIVGLGVSLDQLKRWLQLKSKN